MIDLDLFMSKLVSEGDDLRRLIDLSEELLVSLRELG